MGKWWFDGILYDLASGDGKIDMENGHLQLVLPLNMVIQTIVMLVYHCR